ncbi:hypothetical protein MSG28_001964 [Choristoneura fumiferana]|uniref:Uncharacterized protein n=1 Tax=Choristoneura fumiferana TaxID=7141 RepID=A0ACC0JTG1_CHOFU|nr:hypothetical protein MSG28_001964 [Choristoneura fumiferana]
MARNRGDGLLARVDFPLYTLQTLTNRHVLVAGGGGASNTGVANGFEIFELSHNGERFVAEEVMRHETGPNVVMTCSVRTADNRTYLTAGQESHCQLYRVNIRMVDAAEMRRGSFRAENGLIRKRRRTVSENENISKTDKNSNTMEKRMSFEIRPSDSVQTDFGPDALQRVVSISHSGKLAATGGVDCKVRVWAFPAMKLLFDGLARLWGTAARAPPRLTVACQPPNGTNYLFRRCRYLPQPPNGTNYLFRRCRFGPIEDKKGEYRMFTIANPLARSGKQTGLVQLWSPSDGALRRSVLVGESLSALAVRDDGRFVGVGTMFSGSVHVYVAFNLQRVLHVKRAHRMFVTGLAFLPVAGFGPPITSGAEAALLSISVDNCLRVHSLPYPGTMPAWVAILIIVFVLFCTFTLCSYLGI